MRRPDDVSRCGRRPWIGSSPSWPPTSPLQARNAVRRADAGEARPLRRGAGATDRPVHGRARDGEELLELADRVLADAVELDEVRLLDGAELRLLGLAGAAWP